MPEISQFWQGVLSSIVAAAIIAAASASLPLARGYLGQSLTRRRMRADDLRRKMMSADSVLRVEGYFNALFTLLKYLFVGSILWVLGDVAKVIAPVAVFVSGAALVVFVAGLVWLARVVRPADTSDRIPAAGALRIVGATYGARGYLVDVRQALESRIVDGRLRVYVGNQLGGDPVPGTPKQLEVTYVYADAEQHRIVQEGEDLSLP